MSTPTRQRAERFQGYGTVLVFDPADRAIRHATTSAEAVLGRTPAELLGTRLDDLLAPGDLRLLLELLPERAADLGWQRVELTDGRLVKVHGFEPTPGLIGLDVIPQPANLQSSGAQAVERVAQWTERLLGTTEVPELLELATLLVTTLSGYEGAWACRVEPEGHGVVLAATAPNTSDIIGQFVPATDLPPGEPILHGRPIPYFVADLTDEPVELVPPPPAGATFGTSTLHRPYPAFLDRLLEIGVQATLSIPVVIDGAVYARLVAHDPNPHRVLPAVQAELRLLGAATSTHLSELLRLQETRERLDRATWSSRILEAIADAGDLADGLRADPQALLGLCSATSAVVSIEGRARVVGDPVSDERRDELLRLARIELDRQGESSIHASGLRSPSGPDLLLPAISENFLAVRLGRDSDSLVVWIRRGRRQSVAWVDHHAVGADHPDTLFGGMGERLAEEPNSAVTWNQAQVQAVADFHAALANLIMARYQQVAQLNGQLARSNSEFDAFAHAAAHDLKQPIRGIRQYTEFFLEDVSPKLTEDERDQLGTVLTLTTRMTNLLDGLMRYAELGDPHGNAEPVDLRAAVAEAVELLPPTAVERAQIEVEDAELATDPGALQQLLLNLIGNAVKYSDAGAAQVHVALTTLGEVARLAPPPTLLEDAAPSTPVLTVCDRGIGIEARHQRTIFQLFKQIRPDTPGSGAGLAICRRIARRNGGDIWVRSEPGEGSTFYVVFGT